MEIVEHGIVRDGAIAFDNPLALPEGSRVIARVEVDLSSPEMSAGKLSTAEFRALPFFGQWADRTDLLDSAAYVQEERSKWQQRVHADR